mgnify:CR=1 FL=1
MIVTDLDYYKRTVKEDPHNEVALANLARCYLEEGDETSALQIFHEYSGPNINDLFTDFIYSLQLQNRYEEGFNLYDQLIHSNGGYTRCPRYFDYLKNLKKFNQDDVNKRLLVCGVDAIGDQIFYSSFFHDLLQITNRITAIVLPRLVEPLSRMFPLINFVDDDRTILTKNFDCVTLMALLPRFAIDSNNQLKSKRKPALSPSYKIDFSNNKLTIGFAWGSTRPSDEDETYIKDHKTIDFNNMLPLFRLPNTEFINLQHGDIASDIDEFSQENNLSNIFTLKDLDTTEDIKGIINTVAACDILITPSNTLAHIAGALHKKTYTILPHGHSPARLWFWHRSNDGKNIWYPTINTYEQVKEGDWSHPIEQLIIDLKEGGLI